MDNFPRPIADSDVAAYPAGTLIPAPGWAGASGYLILEGTIRWERGGSPSRSLSAGATLTGADVDWPVVAVTDCRLARLTAPSGARRDWALPAAGSQGDPQRWALHW